MIDNSNRMRYKNRTRSFQTLIQVPLIPILSKVVRKKIHNPPGTKVTVYYSSIQLFQMPVLISKNNYVSKTGI